MCRVSTSGHEDASRAVGTHPAPRPTRQALSAPSWGEHSRPDVLINAALCASKIRSMLTLGAVVLTLKATGWTLGLVTVSVRCTSCVKGPSSRRGRPSAACAARLRSRTYVGSRVYAGA
jgi:hypothetical protein